MAAAHARRSLTGALDIFEDNGMTRLRTAVDRSRRSNHEAERGAAARASRRGFVRSEARPHVGQLFRVKRASGADRSVDAGFAAGSVLTGVWAMAQARIDNGIGKRCHFEARDSWSWRSTERMSNNRLKLTVRGRSVPESRSRSRTAA